MSSAPRVCFLTLLCVLVDHNAMGDNSRWQRRGPWHNWLLLCVTGQHLLLALLLVPSSEPTYRDPESAQFSCLIQCGGETVASKYSVSTF